jgi:hypothetical protein
LNAWNATKFKSGLQMDPEYRGWQLQSVAYSVQVEHSICFGFGLCFYVYGVMHGPKTS